MATRWPERHGRGRAEPPRPVGRRSRRRGASPRNRRRGAAAPVPPTVLERRAAVAGESPPAAGSDIHSPCNSPSFHFKQRLGLNPLATRGKTGVMATNTTDYYRPPPKTAASARRPPRTRLRPRGDLGRGAPNGSPTSTRPAAGGRRGRSLSHVLGYASKTLPPGPTASCPRSRLGDRPPKLRRKVPRLPEAAAGPVSVLRPRYVGRLGVPLTSPVTCRRSGAAP